MSYFSVRLLHAGLAIAVAAVVGGSAMQPDQPEEPAKQPPKAEQQVELREQPKQEVSGLEWQKGECGAPTNGEGMSSLLVRLSLLVDPRLSADEAADANAPSGKLYLQAIERNPNGPESRLGIADSLCVVRTPNGAGKPTWWVHYQGHVARTAQR